MHDYDIANNYAKLHSLTLLIIRASWCFKYRVAKINQKNNTYNEVRPFPCMGYPFWVTGVTTPRTSVNQWWCSLNGLEPSQVSRWTLRSRHWSTITTMLGPSLMKVCRWAFKHSFVKKLLNKPRTLIKNYRNGNEKMKIIRNLRIGTWNIKTLCKPEALKIITDKVATYNLQIITLQDMRWPGNGSIKQKVTTILYSRCGDNRHEFGVGFTINA